MPDPEVEEIAQTGPATSPEEVGGTRDEEGRFQPDFDSVIDGIAGGLKKDGKNFLAEDLIGDGPTGPVKAPPAEVESQAATGPSGLTAADQQQTGASGPTAPVVADARDKDLDELQGQLGDLTKRPKTKQIIEGYKGKIVQERNRAIAIEKERDAFRTEVEESKKRAIPKEVEEELKTLRDAVREIDAARDPALVQKYDKRIATNEETVVRLLKEHGYGLDKEGKEIPGAVERLKAGGISRRVLQDTISKLEKTGDGAAIEAAEEIKEALRENARLGVEKKTEIDSFKAGADDRKKNSDAETTRQVEAANKRAGEVIAEHVAKWDFLKTPPEAKPEDAPAVRAEKEKARVAHNDRINRWNEAIKKETGSPLDAQIAARAGLLYRDVIAPQLQSQLESARKEIETLTNQVKAMRGAGDLSRKQSTSAAKPPPQDDGDSSGGFDDTVDAAARKLGLIK